jgi:hypothetical protein
MEDLEVDVRPHLEFSGGGEVGGSGYCWMEQRLAWIGGGRRQGPSPLQIWQIVPAASNGGGRVTGDFPSEASSNGVAGLPVISRATRTKTYRVARRGEHLSKKIHKRRGPRLAREIGQHMVLLWVHT